MGNLVMMNTENSSATSRHAHSHIVDASLSFTSPHIARSAHILILASFLVSRSHGSAGENDGFSAIQGGGRGGVATDSHPCWVWICWVVGSVLRSRLALMTLAAVRKP